MDPTGSNRHRKIKDVFLAASALEPLQQREFLDRACAGDPDLRAEVESLIESDRAASTPLDALPAAAEILRSELAGSPDGEPPKPLPETIGGYRIIKKLGEGGMGVVYEAEQANPRRTVALKVIQAGAVSRSALRRFEREAEVLGQLQHPGIAQIYEAGASDTVQPFFAMELVQGEPLLEHADKNRLGTRGRLELLARVSDAVDHAHQKGIIHRDLKPGNILVDAMGQPKVLDFGIARLTESDLQTATLQTATGQIVGTVPYMSPEQASGDPAALDRRTDVYSLGVIFYELLTGRLPLHLEGKPLPEALRIIREDEPSRIGFFGRDFRGDIETIAAKALEKEKGRRYATAAELAADIRRHLADQPIAARPTSALYQIRKFARRNRALVSGLVIAFAALIAGTAVSVWQAGVAIEQGRNADRRAQQAVLQAYRASMAAAAAAMEADDPVTVEEQLESIEPNLRDWSWRYFWNRKDRSVAVLRPEEPIAGASFNDDGSRVVLACEKGGLRWWDPLLGEESSTHPIGPPPIHVAAFSPDGALVAALVGPERREIGWWETSTGRTLAEAKAVDRPCHSVAISADGRWIVAAGIERVAWIWDTSTSRLLRIDGKLLYPATYARPIAFYPNEPALLIAGNLGWLGKFDLSTGERKDHRDIGTLDIHCLRFNRDGTVVAIGERSNKLYLGSIATGQPIGLFLGHKSGVMGVDLRPDEGQIASAGDRTVRLYDLPSGKPAAVLTGHEAEVRSVAYSPDGSRLLSASRDRTARIWDPRQSESVSVQRVDKSYARSLALFPGGKRFLTGAWHGQLQVWDAETLESLGSYSAVGPGESSTGVAAVAIPRVEAKYFASGHSGGALRIWDAWSGALISEAKGQFSRAWTTEIALSPDGSLLASPHRDGTFAVWRAPGLAQVSTSGVIGKSIRCPRFTSDGSRLALGVDHTVRLFDAISLNEVRAYDGPADDVTCVAFSHDETLLAAGAADRTVRVWEAATGRPLRVLSGHNGAVSALAFTPDGLRLASGSDDASIRIWDPAAGHQVAHLRGHSGSIGTLEFSPDGARLFSTSGDGTVRIWDTAPQWSRWQARHRRRRLLVEVEPQVSRLLEEMKEPASVAERIRTDARLSEAQREAALQAVLMKAIQTRAQQGPISKPTQ